MLKIDNSEAALLAQVYEFILSWEIDETAGTVEPLAEGTEPAGSDEPTQGESICHEFYPESDSIESN